MAEVAYVGSRTLGSAIGMDKDVAKRLAREGGIDVTPFLAFVHVAWSTDPMACERRIEEALGFPVFVKPSNMGSSIGVTRVDRREDLAAAIGVAFELDRKVLVEAAVDAREIEVAVLGPWGPSGQIETSLAGEIVPRDRFYSYERKYEDDAGAELLAPAPISDEESDHVRKLAARAFRLLECEGLARMDFFLDRATGRFLFSEVNTLPGFTAISMFPKLWEISDLSFGDLLDRLIDDAIARHAARAKLRRTNAKR
jgi:D-alanine-D-alanine ligase